MNRGMQKNRQRVLVWGAGGHGKVVVDALMEGALYEIGGIIDEDSSKHGSELLGVKVMAFEGDLMAAAKKLRCDCVVIAIGDNYARHDKFQKIAPAGLAPVNVLHPRACVSRFVKMGEGVTILAGATINAGTVIEDNVCVNTSASIDHDNYLAHGCHIFPNATLTGGIRVGEFAYVGSGAVIKPKLTVQKYSYVGAGAVVVADVPEGAIVCGVPAKIAGQQEKRPASEKR
jgi:sugar O-acyltransferase (sialic acid O-acetyltransferase NeuD family)